MRGETGREGRKERKKRKEGKGREGGKERQAGRERMREKQKEMMECLIKKKTITLDRELRDSVFLLATINSIPVQ